MAKIFVDLENTLIEDWYTPTLLRENVEKIKTLIRKAKVEKIYLWSFAVTNSKEVEDFNRLLKDFLERALGVSIEVLEINECFTEVCKANGIKAKPNELTDVFLFEPKGDLLREWLIAKKIKGNCYLIDDMVRNSSYKQENLYFECIKMDEKLEV